MPRGILWTMEKYVFGGINITAHSLEEGYLSYPNSQGEVAVFSHPVHDEPIDLFKEIGGESERLKDIVLYSREQNNTVIAGITLEYGRIKRLSAAIAHKGELVDVADSCSVSEPYTRSGTVKIYNTGKIKIAVLTGGDARVSFILSKISGYCNLVVSLEPEYRPENEQRIRKLSDNFLLPILYVSPARIFFAGRNRYGDTLN